MMIDQKSFFAKLDEDGYEKVKENYENSRYNRAKMPFVAAWLADQNDVLPAEKSEPESPDLEVDESNIQERDEIIEKDTGGE
jgi:hypothetical protein